jgi:hypothetical protein
LSLVVGSSRLAQDSKPDNSSELLESIYNLLISCITLDEVDKEVSIISLTHLLRRVFIPPLVVVLFLLSQRERIKVGCTRTKAAGWLENRLHGVNLYFHLRLSPGSGLGTKITKIK